MDRITSTGIALHDSWKPAVQSEQKADPMAFDLVLTPQELDQVALAKCHLEAHVRRLNRLDTAQAVADELVRREML